jgi:hypothetical protein
MWKLTRSQVAKFAWGVFLYWLMFQYGHWQGRRHQLGVDQAEVRAQAERWRAAHPLPKCDDTPPGIPDYGDHDPVEM